MGKQAQVALGINTVRYNLVVAGPTGSGKSSFIDFLFCKYAAEVGIITTTMNVRGHDVDGLASRGVGLLGCAWLWEERQHASRRDLRGSVQTLRLMRYSLVRNSLFWRRGRSLLPTPVQ